MFVLSRWRGDFKIIPHPPKKRVVNPAVDKLFKNRFRSQVIGVAFYIIRVG